MEYYITAKSSNKTNNKIYDNVGTKYTILSDQNIRYCRKKIIDTVGTKYTIPSEQNIRYCRNKINDKFGTKYTILSEQNIRYCWNKIYDTVGTKYMYTILWEQNIRYCRNKIYDTLGGKIDPTNTISIKPVLRWYLTRQGDNSLKSVERFDNMMFACRLQASRWSKSKREKLLCG